MNKKVHFSIEDIDLIEEDSNSQFATARIQAFSSDKNLHDLVCDEGTLKATAPTLYDKPILYSIDEGLDDFYTHVAPEKSLICGFVIPDSAEFIRLPDSRLSVSVMAKIWKRYAPKVMELFKRDDGSKKVSVEMELFETEPIDDILTKMVSFAYTGICILGTFVSEASPGANIQVLSFAQEAKEYNSIIKKEFSNEPENLLFSIPNGVKETVKKASRDNKRKGGGTSVTLSVAKLLSNNDSLTKEEVLYVNSHLGNKKYSELNFMLCGGDEGRKWCGDLIENFENENKEKMEMKNMDKVEKKEEMAEEVLPVEKTEMAEEVAPEKKEEMAEEVAPEKDEVKPEQKKFEFPANFDMEAMGKFFAEEEDDFCKMAAEEVKKEFADPAVVMSGMFAKMCKMSDAMCKMADDSKAYMAENEELKKFKADFEQASKLFEVEKTFVELAEKVVLSAEDKAEMSAEAEKYSFAEIDKWKTYCKAKSFDFATKDGGNSNVKRIGMPFSASDLKAKDELWAE